MRGNMCSNGAAAHGITKILNFFRLFVRLFARRCKYQVTQLNKSHVEISERAVCSNTLPFLYWVHILYSALL